MPSIGTCFRFYTQMRVQKKTKLLPIKLKTVYTTVYLQQKSRNFKNDSTPLCFHRPPFSSFPHSTMPIIDVWPLNSDRTVFYLPIRFIWGYVTKSILMNIHTVLFTFLSPPRFLLEIRVIIKMRKILGTP